MGADPVPSSLGRHAAIGVLWNVAQKWGIRAGSLLTLALLTRQLEPADFGIVAAALVFIPFLTLLADVGFQSYVVQAERADQRMLSTALWFGLVSGLVLMGATVAAAPLVESLLGLPRFAHVLQGLAPAILLSALMGAPAALLKRRLAFKAIAVRQISAAVGSQVVAVALVLAGAGVWALVGQYVANTFFACVAVWIAARWVPSRQFSPRLAWRMTRFGVKVVLSDITGVLRISLETMIIVTIVGVTGLGYWSIAMRLVNVATDLTASTVVSVSSPVFARIKMQPSRLTDAYLRAQATLYAISGSVMMVLAVVTPLLLPVVFGAQWQPSVFLGQVYAVASIFVIGATLDRGFFLGIGRPGVWLVYVVAVEALTLLATFLAAPYGMRAVVVAFLAVAVFATLVRLAMVAHILGVRRSRPAGAMFLVLVAAGAAAVPSLGLVWSLTDRLPVPLVIVLAMAAPAVVFPLTLRYVRPEVLREVWSLAPERLRRHRPRLVSWLVDAGVGADQVTEPVPVEVAAPPGGQGVRA